MYERILIRYGDLTLKGKNKKVLETGEVIISEEINENKLW